jgi:hypothetical protein
MQYIHRPGPKKEPRKNPNGCQKKIGRPAESKVTGRAETRGHRIIHHLAVGTLVQDVGKKKKRIKSHV